MGDRSFQMSSDSCSVVDASTGEVIKAIPTPHFAKAYFYGESPGFGLLPPAVRWISQNGTDLLVERPPQWKTVVLNDTTYEIPIPWTLWALSVVSNQPLDEYKITSMRAFARPDSIGFFEDQLFSLPFPTAFDERSGLWTGSPVFLPNGISDLPKVINNHVFSFIDKPQWCAKTTVIPPAWYEFFDGKSLDQYLSALEQFSFGDLFQTEFVPSEISTVGDLTQLIETSNEPPPESSTIDYLLYLMERA